MNTFFDYKIPEAIKTAIPDCFYFALLDELKNVFGTDILDYDDAGVCGLDYVGGTGGFFRALETVCKKLHIEWLSEYCDGLAWYDSDLFDGEIIDEVIRRFDNPSC